MCWRNEHFISTKNIFQNVSKKQNVGTRKTKAQRRTCGPRTHAEAFSSYQARVVVGKAALLLRWAQPPSPVKRQADGDLRPGGLELACVEGHDPLGHSEEARQVGGQPAQAGGLGENRTQRQNILDGAA